MADNDDGDGLEDDWKELGHCITADKSQLMSSSYCMYVFPYVRKHCILKLYSMYIFCYLFFRPLLHLNMFTVVEFTQEKTVNVVPMKWIRRSKTNGVSVFIINSSLGHSINY